MNTKNNDNYKTLLTKFVSICDENKLWYSLANNTLLSSKMNNNYYENSDILEIFVTQKTFVFIKTNYRNNIIDFTSSDTFFLSTPFFYIKDNHKFIKMIIIVPTNIQKIIKFKSLRNKIKYNYSNFLTFGKGYNFSTKFIFIWFKILSRFFSPMEQNQFYDFLFEDNYKGFFSINSLNEPSVKNWFPNITFEVEVVLFLGIKTKILKEYDSFLVARYGEKWKNGVQVENIHFDYEKILLNL